MDEFMGMATIRRIASRILGIGEHRIRFEPERLGDIKNALTADDVRGYIDDGGILAMPVKGVPRVRARMHRARRRKGRGGAGSRKGARYAGISRKERWISQVRAQRTLLKKLKEKGQLKEDAYRKSYRMIKGGAFKNMASLLSHLHSAKLLKELKREK